MLIEKVCSTRNDARGLPTGPNPKTFIPITGTVNVVTQCCSDAATMAVVFMEDFVMEQLIAKF
jgi:hypothetical protein